MTLPDDGFHGSRALVRPAAHFVARVVAVLLPPLFLAHAIFAAPKGPAAPPPAGKKPPVWTPKKTADASVDGPSESGPKESVLKVDAGAVSAAAASKDAEVVIKESEKKQGDASVKVFTGGSSEIEGRSRWPAVTYFIRRMRAEFETAKLPHRPFLPEL